MTFDPDRDDPTDYYPSDLHDTDDGRDEEDRRIDQGDGLAPDQVCSFREGTKADGPPCPHAATTVRTMNDIDFSACAHHAERGGWLTPNGRRVIDVLVAVQNRAAARSVLVEGERTTFRLFCESCGCRLGAGNTLGRCAECCTFDAIWPPQATATPPEFPFKLDRFVYGPEAIR